MGSLSLSLSLLSNWLLPIVFHVARVTVQGQHCMSYFMCLLDDRNNVEWYVKVESGVELQLNLVYTQHKMQWRDCQSKPVVKVHSILLHGF